MSSSQQSGISPDLMGIRAIREIREGDVIFPGFGIPMETIPQYIPPELGVTLVSENGLVGHGPLLTKETGWEPEQVNAGGNPVTLLPGASFISELDAFVIMSRRISLAFLGAYQVSEKGDIANWKLLERGVATLGGSMDIALGAQRVVTLMNHTDRSGRPRIVKECSQPITARGVVNLIITNLAVIEVTTDGLLLKEIVPGFSVEEIQALTEPELIISDTLGFMEF